MRLRLASYSRDGSCSRSVGGVDRRLTILASTMKALIRGGFALGEGPSVRRESIR